MEEKMSFNGHIIAYDSNAQEGMRYLTHRISAQEAKVFFDEAYNYGSAVFEDHFGYKYKLIHHGAEYQLVKI